MDYSLLPSVNAALNSASAVLLVAGLIFIKRKAILPHKSCMLGACVTSALFLTSYLYYHYHHGSTKFVGTGWVRPAYFALLLTHTVLAAVIVPMIFMTLKRAFNNDYAKHATIARKTLPLWLYVSVTGVIIYWLLYHVYRSPF